jgi:hypothetical protein
MERFSRRMGVVALTTGVVLATAGASSAMPMNATGATAQAPLIQHVAWGCGPGWHPNPWGRCVPNGPGWGWGGGWGWHRWGWNRPWGWHRWGWHRW